MKVIFSRKGWDSGYGGRPSPIFSDNSLVSLPIECVQGSPLASDVHPPVLSRQGFSSLGNFLQSYHPSASRSNYVHLDPDLDRPAYRRAPGWRPCFGQAAMAAAHLDNQGVGPGDLFLFYGWFDDVTRSSAGWRCAGHDRYMVWGWLQIGEIIHSPTASSVPLWLRYHPHAIHSYPKNRIYIASPTLSFGPQSPRKFAGGGVFRDARQVRCLTLDPGSRGPRPNRLPGWLNHTKFRQEHVWDLDQSPASSRYLATLFG